MNLKDEIKKLAVIQEIDSQIYLLKQKKDFDNPALLNRIQHELEEKKKSLQVFEENVKQIQLRKKDKELELASKEETISKSQGQLYQLKTNKEYQAKLSEIAALKADISILEEEVLKILDEIERAEQKLKAEREETALEEQKTKEKENEINNEQRELGIKSQGFKDKRKILVAAIDPAILVKYEKLISTRAGLALVPVKNESCGACFMRVTHQSINEIKMYKDLTMCQNCVRILYIPEDMEL